MTGKHCVCSLCCHTLEEKDGVVIDESLRRMLQAVLIGIDLTTNPNTLICDNCHKKLEANYNFKRKCIFTEDSITPYVSENVKLNLKEIQNEIIKSEDMENDNNVCRLCLQFVDNDMTLSDSEKDQFQRFFPEIDLYRTNFVILCSTCYDHLHKYFVFVTLCLALDQQKSDNLYQLETKIDIEKEGISCKLENMEEHIEGIKKEVELLNEDLDIKCDTEDKDEDDERYDTNNQDAEQLLRKESSDCDIFSAKSISEQGEEIDTFYGHISDKNADARNTFFSGSKEFESTSMHFNDFKIIWHKCEYCGQEFKLKQHLKTHVLNVHTDPTKIAWYHCQQCDKKFKHKTDVKRHIRYMHSDPSTIDWYACDQCDKKYKAKQGLKNHVFLIHTDPSKIVLTQCEQCNKKFKDSHYLRYHILNNHADPSTITWYKCEQCNKKFKCKTHLKRHITCVHTDPSDIAWYQCEQCDKKFKHRPYLKRHVTYVHTDRSIITWHTCEQCDKKFKEKNKLMKHYRIKHNSSSNTAM